jgi:hypothetical protein
VNHGQGFGSRQAVPAAVDQIDDDGAVAPERMGMIAQQVIDDGIAQFRLGGKRHRQAAVV